MFYRILVRLAHTLFGYHPPYNAANYWFYSDGTYATLEEQEKAVEQMKLEGQALECIADHFGEDYVPSEQEVKDWMRWCSGETQITDGFGNPCKED